MATRIGTGTAALIATALALAACGGGGGGGGHDASRVPSAAEISGTYDLTTTTRGSAEPSRSGVGVIGVGDELHVELSDPPAVLSGVLQPDGRVRLEGRATATDVISPLHATARVRVISGAYWFTGSIPALDVDFAMSRPVGSDLRTAGGRYRLTFTRRIGSCACPSTIDLDAEIDAGGSSTLGDTRLVDDRGNLLAELSSTTFDVAPSGRFHFETTYAEANGSCGFPLTGGPCLLRVDGRLPVSGEATAQYDLLSGLRMHLGGGDLQIERID